MAGATWHGLAHAADWYTTIAELAGVTDLSGTGMVAPDGVALWDAIAFNASSPRTELVINIDSNADGEAENAVSVLRQGRWKLIDGYPGWTNDAWNGWIPLPNASTALRTRTDWVSDAVLLDSAHGRGEVTLRGDPAKPCSAAPCLFDVLADPQERHDLAAGNPAIVKAMQARIAEHYAPTEVTVKQSGICPFVTYDQTDAGCCGMAARTGFWMPWCDAGSGFTCTLGAPGSAPTPPIPEPAPFPVVPTPPACSDGQRMTTPAEYDEVRADGRAADAWARVTKQAWAIVVADAKVGTVSLKLAFRASSSPMVLSVSGATIANATHGDARLRKTSTMKKADASWAAQQWKQQPLAAAAAAAAAAAGEEFSLLHAQSGNCLALQQGSASNIEVAPCVLGSARQVFAHNVTDGTLRFTRAPYVGLLVNTC